MKSFITATILITSVLGAALPRDTPTATVALSNDQTGAYGGVAIPLDNTSRLVSDLYSSTGINQGGVYQASSANLVGGLANNPVCTITAADGSTVLASLNSQKTFAKFGSNPDVLTVIDVSGASITCSQ